MTPKQALELLCATVPYSDKTEAACDALYALLRRDWAVRVLDAWRAARGGRYLSQGAASCEIVEKSYGKRMCAGLYVEVTPDAARHAAALALFPTLSEAKRAELGECP